MIEIVRGELGSNAAQALILALNAELEERYPEEGANHFSLAESEVAAGSGAFLLAHVDGVATGCGAVRRISAVEAEIKRMYVMPDARGNGLGRKLLDALEAEARSLGCQRLVLETGERQPEALALYGSAGFVQIPLFGEYIGSPLSLCMAKELA